MKPHKFEAEAAVEFDVENAFNWYESQEAGLGLEFLEQLPAAYLRMLENPSGYQELRSGIRPRSDSTVPLRGLLFNRDETILILAVLHTARDPAEWQRRI